MNSQRRRNVRVRAIDYVAWVRVGDIDAVRQDDELRDRQRAELASARSAMEREIRRAYYHAVYLDEGSDGRVEKEIRFEQDNQSALDGSVVWAKLVEAGKAFGSGEFDAKALLHNLLDHDYG